MTTFPYRRFLKDGAYVTAFNVACALAVTYILGTGGSFSASLVYSMCIGTIAYLVIDVTRFLLWGEDRPRSWPLFAIVLLGAVLVAQLAGSALGAWIVGADMPVISTIAPNNILFTLFAVGAATIFFISRDRLIRAQALAANERARAEAIGRQAVQAQLQLLQAQLEPHMLFNTLANVQGLIAIDAPRAQQMLDQLIQYLRATLSASRAQSTTLEQEFALTDAYLGLMAVRMGRRLSYSLDLPQELAKLALPPMLLQPLVANAIAHGLEPTVDGGHVAVSARRDGEQVILCVADNGRGPDAPPGKQGTGLGLANTRQRLDALFGERASLSLAAAAPRGAIATLTFPA